MMQQAAKVVRRAPRHDAFWPAVTFALAVLAYALEWLVYRPGIFTDNASAVATFAKAFPDAALVFALYWWCGPRWRWTVLIPVWAVPLWEWVNLMYFRQFHFVMPMSSLRFTENADATLFNSVGSLVRLADVWLLVLPLAFTLAWALWLRPRMRGKRVGLPLRLWATAACLLLVAAGQLWNDIVVHRELVAEGIDHSASSVLARKYSRECSASQSLYHLGLPLSFALGLGDLFADYTPVELSAGERARVEAYVAGQRRLWDADTVVAANRDKNLVVVIVESLNSWAITPQTTPVLDSLVRREGTVSALGLVAQVGLGASSDGQFMIGTGLLPLRDCAVAMSYFGNRFPSLARELGRPCVQVEDKHPHFWRWDDMVSALGFDRYVARDTLDARHGVVEEAGGADARLFAEGLRLARTLPQPFFVQLNTRSMHAPYKAGILPPDSIPAGVADGAPPVMARYLAVTAYFDRQLGNFLAGLRSAGLDGNTVVVIVSDHDAPVQESDGRGPAASPVAFIAANTGLTERIGRQAGQVDIYPTVLHLMGLEAPSWPGVGTSLLNPDLDGAVGFDDTRHGSATARQAEAWEVSRLLITSDAFAR